MHTIDITMDGGIVQDITNIPAGVAVRVRDYDVEGCSLDDDKIITDPAGEECFEFTYEGEDSPTPTSPAAGQGSWYLGHSAGGHHGIVACERTGRTVALVYDPDDTPLLAAAPELLEVLKHLRLMLGPKMSPHDIVLADHAIAKAEGR